MEQQTQSPESKGVYHTPGNTIQCRDGAEYVVQKNGSWLRTKKKTRWKDIREAATAKI